MFFYLQAFILMIVTFVINSFLLIGIFLLMVSHFFVDLVGKNKCFKCIKCIIDNKK